MITPDDNGYVRLKRWREKNRALSNLRQRQYRQSKKNFPVTKAERSGALAGDAPKSGAMGGRPCEGNQEIREPLRTSTQPFETKKVGEFRMLVLSEEKREEVPVKPQVFRNDYGAVISERAWNLLQKKKQEAKEGGYELDEYSQ